MEKENSKNSKNSVTNISTTRKILAAMDVPGINAVTGQSKSLRSLISSKVYNTFDKNKRKKIKIKNVLSKTEENIEEEIINPRKELKEIKVQLAIQQSNKDMLRWHRLCKENEKLEKELFLLSKGIDNNLRNYDFIRYRMKKLKKINENKKMIKKLNQEHKIQKYMDWLRKQQFCSKIKNSGKTSIRMNNLKIQISKIEKAQKLRKELIAKKSIAKQKREDELDQIKKRVKFNLNKFKFKSKSTRECKSQLLSVRKSNESMKKKYFLVKDKMKEEIIQSLVEKKKNYILKRLQKQFQESLSKSLFMHSIQKKKLNERLISLTPYSSVNKSGLN